MKTIILSILIGLIISLIIGIILIPLLKKLSAIQSVSRNINKRHLTKEGTPTMGGLIFILSVIIGILLMVLTNKIKMDNNLYLILLIMILYSMLGFIDDYLKAFKHNNKGLPILYKLLGQVLISILFYIIFIVNKNDTFIYFFNFSIDLKWLYGIFIFFVIVGSSNAINITDGLDGLAGGLCLITFMAFGLVSSGNIQIFCFLFVGSMLGFLVFNFFPAKVFMGDLGSLSLGATLGVLSIILNLEFFYFLIAFIFVLETLVSLLQIISIRIFNIKIFKKSPLHHHFEEKGWSETSIIKLFYMIGIIFTLIGLIYYYNFA